MVIERGDWQFEAGRHRREWGLGISLRYMSMGLHTKLWVLDIKFGFSWYLSLEHFKYEEETEPEPGTLRYMEWEMRQDVVTGIVESLCQKDE